MSHRRLLIIIALLAALGISAAALFGFGDHSRDRVTRASTIRIGYAVEAPFAFIDPGGRVTGESPELARAIAERMGIATITWVQTDFDQLIADLNTDRFDVIAAGMFITPARARLVAFSQPTFHVAQGLLVRAGNPLGISSYAQVADMPDVRIAVISGALEESLLLRSGVAPGQLVYVPDALTGRVAVESGLADGLALSAPTLRWMIASDQGLRLELADPFVQPAPALASRAGYGAFAFRQADRQLREAWDKAMGPLIGSPEHLKIIEPFGFSAASLPGGVSTEEVLAP